MRSGTNVGGDGENSMSLGLHLREKRGQKYTIVTSSSEVFRYHTTCPDECRRRIVELDLSTVHFALLRRLFSFKGMGKTLFRSPSCNVRIGTGNCARLSAVCVCDSVLQQTSAKMRSPSADEEC